MRRRAVVCPEHKHGAVVRLSTHSLTSFPADGGYRIAHPGIALSAAQTRISIKGRLGGGDCRLIVFPHLVEGDPDLFQFYRPTSIGEEAKMTNAHEAFRQNMQEETANELFTR